jgi:hypothetical protein
MIPSWVKGIYFQIFIPKKDILIQGDNCWMEESLCKPPKNRYLVILS